MIGVGVLAFRPLLDPLPLHDAWYWLMPPLAVLLSVGYKAVRTPGRGGAFDARLFLRQAAVMSVQVVAAIAMLYAAAVLLVAVLLERIT